jgi:hypothetical protein
MNTPKSLFEGFREKPYRNIFLSLIGVILIDALAPNYAARGLFSDLMLAAIFFVALAETVRSRPSPIWALIFGVPAIAARLIAAFRPDTTVQNAMTLTLSALFFIFLIWNLLHDLAQENRSTDERIFGALCAYIFIGIFFALIYAHMEYRQAGTFAVSNQIISAAESEEASLMPVFTYYSFVTLTTLGYGDVAPVAEHARTLAWLEALLGQLYLAVMVAGFVAVHISERMTTDRRDPPPDG